MDLEKQKLRIYNLIADGKRPLIHDDYDNAMAWLDFASQRIGQLKKPDGIVNPRIAPEQLNLDYIECGGLQWALQNAGTDAENPNGKLYTFDEALTLENDLWRGPTHEEQEMFIDRTYHGFDKERKVMIFVDRKTGVMLEFPAVGYRYDSSGALTNPGTLGDYWSSTQSSSTYAYSMNFNSSLVSTNDYDKRYGFSVRLVRR